MPSDVAASSARASAVCVGGALALVTLVSAALGARGFSLHAGQGNPNWLGLVFAVSLPLMFDACIMHWKARAVRSARGAATFLLTASAIAALYLSHSRVSWVATGVAAAFVIVGSHSARRAPRNPRVLRYLGAALTVTFALVFSAGARATERDALSDDVPAARSLAGRTFIWQSSMRAAKDALPFGAGLGNFGFAFHDAQSHALLAMSEGAAARAYENATTAHEEYLQTATESGPLATLALLLALALGVLAHARARFFGGAGALIGCAVASLGDSPIRQPAVVLVVALVLGATRSPAPALRAPARAFRAPARAFRAPARAFRAIDTRAIVHRALFLALLFASAVLLAASTRAWLSTRMDLASFDGDPAQRLALCTKSMRIDPANAEAIFERGLLLSEAGDARAALTDFDEASTRLADPAIFVAKGEAHLQLDELPAAATSYRTALGWNPGSLRARVGLAETRRREGRLDDAEAAAAIAHAISPGDARVRELLDAIHEQRADAPPSLDRAEAHRLSD